MTTRFATIPSLWALALGAALAQQTPPTAPEEDEEKPAPSYPKIDVGYGSWGLSGNFRTFGRYGAPPRGFFVRELSYGQFGLSPALFGEFTFRGQPFDDHVFETKAIWGPDASTLEGSIENSVFYQPSAHPIDESKRRTMAASYRRPLGKETNLTVDYSHNQLDTNVEGPGYGKHQRTNRFSGSVAGPLGSGRYDLSLADRRFYDRANFQPDTRTQTWRGEVLQPIGKLNLSGLYAHTNIEQNGRRDSEAKNWAIDGDLPIGYDLDLQFGFRTEKYDLPETINAYVRERHVSYARLNGYFSGLSTQLGWRHTETERVRLDQRFVDVPKIDLYEGRITGRIRGGSRWSLKGSIEDHNSNAVMLTSDPRRLYWDDKVTVQAKIDHGGETWGAYGAVNFRYMENSPREIKVRTRQYVFGANCWAVPGVDFFGELMIDNADTRFREQDATVDLDSFFPSSRVWTMGANWAINENTMLTTSFTDLVTDNDNPIFEPGGNVANRFWTAHLRHRDRMGREFGLMIAPGKYTDKVIRQLGYEARVVMVTAQWKF